MYATPIETNLKTASLTITSTLSDLKLVINIEDDRMDNEDIINYLRECAKSAPPETIQFMITIPNKYAHNTEGFISTARFMETSLRQQYDLQTRFLGVFIDNGLDGV